MKTAGSKLLLALLMATMVGGTVAIPTPARAQIPVTDTANLVPTVLTQIWSSITSGATVEGAAATNIDAAANVAHLGEQLLKWIEETLIQKLKKALLDYLVDRVISYISGAKDGGFIGDWQSYLSGAVATELDAWSTEFLGVSLCSPFQAQLKIVFAKPSVPTFAQKYKCTFDDIGQNLEDFYQDFRKGGWIAYEKAWEPQNNIYGVYLMASIEQAATAQLRKETALAEASAGAGFLSKKECEEGAANGSLPGSDIDGDGKPNDIASTCKIITPGSTVAAAVAKAATVEFDYINSLTGTDIGPYLAAIVDAMVGRVLDEGLSLVAQAAGPSKRNIDNYVDASSIDRSAGQRFRNQSIRISKDIRDAIAFRESARTSAVNATTTWLKYTHNASNIAEEAVRQITMARDVLRYAYGELSKVTKKSQIRAGAISGTSAQSLTELQKLCRVVRSVPVIDDTALPRIRRLIDQANEAVETLKLSWDDYPLIDPEFVTFAEVVRDLAGGNIDAYFAIKGANSPADLGLTRADQSSNPTPTSHFDPTTEDNDDQLALLYEAQYQLENELVENTSTTQFYLGELATVLGGGLVNEARQFKNAMKRIDDDIEKVLKNATGYANRISKCFNPRDESNLNNGVVVGWSAGETDQLPNDADYIAAGKPDRRLNASNPSDRGFPWETASDPDEIPEIDEEETTSTSGS